MANLDVENARVWMERLEAVSHVCLEVDPKDDLARAGLKRQVEVTRAAIQRHDVHQDRRCGDRSRRLGDSYGTHFW